MNKIELLAPAGNAEALSAAIGEGADAVYLGLKNFNARLRSSNFAYSQFEGAVKAVHKLGKKIYVTVNTVFVERESDRVYQLLKYIMSVGADAIIVQDLGIIKMVGECFSSLKIHSSTQMNIASSKACNVLSKKNVSRVVLSRELSLDEIKQIRQNTNVELEIFVHGALCVSASGLCLFSSFLGGKSANRGMCTQACRRLYSADDENGYYFSPSDLQLLEKIPSIVDAGINSIKIEGRMKSADYVGTVVSAYRKVVDAVYDGDLDVIKNAILEGKKILAGDFARDKTFFHFEENDPRIYIKAGQDGGTGIKLGSITKIRGADSEKYGLVKCDAFVPKPSDSIRLHKSNDSERKTHKLLSVNEDRDGSYWLDIPPNYDIGDVVYLIQTKSLSKRYQFVVPKDLSFFKKQPGRDRTPLIKLDTKKKIFFPEGLYINVGRIDDFYVAQSIKPDFIIINFNSKNASAIIDSFRENGKTLLPFKSAETILNLDPFYNEGMDKDFSKNIKELINLGYKNYIVNNFAQFSLLQGEEFNLIAGAYLYAFNKYAASFVLDFGVDAIVSPFENSRQNLERTFDFKNRGNVFITVFAYPPLFRIQSDLHSIYDFNKFKDSRDAEFKMVTNKDNTLVFSDSPFSIVDKIPFLQSSGFKRFILDFSAFPLQKKFYKNIITYTKESMPVQGTSRFNWKNGFFTMDENIGEDKSRFSP
jgi:putative protease